MHDIDIIYRIYTVLETKCVLQEKGPGGLVAPECDGLWAVAHFAVSVIQFWELAITMQAMINNHSLFIQFIYLYGVYTL